MQGSLFFVHGTGNWDERRPGLAGHLDAVVTRIRQGLGDNGLADVTVHAPPWAGACAPAWPDVALALPPVVVSRSLQLQPGGGPGAEPAGDLWDLLLLDPLIELRVAGLAAPADTAMVPGAMAPDVVLAGLANDLDLSSEQAATLGIETRDIAAAAARVADSEELRAAAVAAGNAADPELLDMTARAVVATLLAGYRDLADDVLAASPPAAIDASARGALVDAIRAALAAGTYRGFMPSRVRSALVALAARVGTSWAVPRRGTWMDPVTSFAADIAYYLRHGAEVRDYLRTQLERLPAPVVVLGHSLGGVAMVDLLSAEDPPGVGLLVTAGSQAPYLYLLDALANLRPGAQQARPFAPWINVYNPRDLLSFCAQRVFPTISGIQDIPVDPGVPFPESHSGYWESREMWAAMVERWPR